MIRRRAEGVRCAYDQEVDAVYLRLGGGVVHETVVVDDWRNVDLAADGSVLGIEVLGVRAGVRLADVAARFGLEARLPELERAVAAARRPRRGLRRR